MSAACTVAAVAEPAWGGGEGPWQFPPFSVPCIELWVQQAASINAHFGASKAMPFPGIRICDEKEYIILLKIQLFVFLKAFCDEIQD